MLGAAWFSDWLGRCAGERKRMALRLYAISPCPRLPAIIHAVSYETKASLPQDRDVPGWPPGSRIRRRHDPLSHLRHIILRHIFEADIFEA